jgi:hypothetical protein
VNATGSITVNPAPTAIIATSGTVCLPTVTFTGANGTAPYTFTYKIGDGVPTTVKTTDGNSVSVTPNTTGASTYTLLSVKDDNNCGQVQGGSVTVTVLTRIVGGIIVYNGNPYCSNGGTATVTVTAPAGGVYSTDATGLSINASTGAVNLAATTPGTYLVQYAYTDTCNQSATTTAVITITAAPTATIAYSGTPYCANGGTASVTRTGSSGGTFSSTAGLVIDATTGAIDLAASTPGTYLVTLTIAAANGCAEFKTTANVTIQGVLAAPTISSNPSNSVCAGTEVLLFTNCPQGSTVLWSNGSTATVLALNANNPSSQTLTAKCQQKGFCESTSSVPYSIEWISTFSLTPINIGQSQSGIKAINDKSAWSSQFITPDAGPTLEYSTQANPTIYYSENMNKTAPRYWTIHAEACALGTAGSLTFDMLATPEVGVIRSYNTHENNAPYLMYANRAGFTELYAQNHPVYGFFLDDGSGGNLYDVGLPKGSYKLGIRYWDQKGQGSIFPATRQPQGNVLTYQEFWFRIQSKDGVGKGAARVAADNGQRPTDNGFFAQVMPNPVAQTLHLKVTDTKGQKVNVSLLDASGRMLLRRAFVPETNAHQEELNVSEITNGMYFLRVHTAEKQATLKFVKVE